MREISNSLKSFTTRYDDEELHLESNVVVYHSNIHGYGLFAAKNLKVNDLVCRYSGKYLDYVDEHVDTSYVAGVVLSYNKKGEPQEKMYIDSISRENFSGRWINHSHSPNAKLVIPLGEKPLYDSRRDVWYIFVQCLCDIKKGDEIFVDYSKEYYTFSRVDAYGVVHHSLSFEYYSGVTGEALENLKRKLVFTFEESVTPDLRRTRICGEFQSKYEEIMTQLYM